MAKYVEGPNGERIQLPSPEEAMNTLLNEVEPATDEEVPPHLYRDLREAIGWDIGRCSEALGIPAEVVADIESGKRKPDGFLSSGYRRFAAAAAQVLEANR